MKCLLPNGIDEFYLLFVIFTVIIFYMLGEFETVTHRAIANSFGETKTTTNHFNVKINWCPSLQKVIIVYYHLKP